MTARTLSAIPVLPAASLDASLQWWQETCGFQLSFRHGNYAGIHRDQVSLHLSEITSALARTVGNQTMLRVGVDNVQEFFAEYQQRGGQVHPNGTLHETPWGSIEFAAIDPCGVCVTFFQ